ncbi:PREDICTED: protein FAR1-RELATED SEQUENCE 3-like [Fragaria vesca subsp. vesca]
MKEAHITLKQGTECHEDGSRVYKVSVYKRPNFEHTVTYYPRKETESAADPIMVCSCGMFEYRGVPCRHMFSVMKNENIFHLHKSLIVKRWSRDARSVCEIPYPDKEMPQEAVQVSRYGALIADCNRLCFYASKTQEGYNMLKMEIDRLAAIMEGSASDQEKVQGTATPTKKGSIVRDLVPSKTKGREKSDKKNEPSRRKVTCGYCKGGGHNIQTCPVRKEH